MTFKLDSIGYGNSLSTNYGDFTHIMGKTPFSNPLLTFDNCSISSKGNDFFEKLLNIKPQGASTASAQASDESDDAQETQSENKKTKVKVKVRGNRNKVRIIIRKKKKSGKTEDPDKSKEPKKSEDPQGPKDKQQPKFRATAKDMELLKRRGASTTTNDPNAAAQFVEGNEDGEVKVRCSFDACENENEDMVEGCCKNNPQNPKYIEITDNTNGKKNTYKYRKITAEEMKNGETSDGKKLNKEQFKNGQYSYYILESVVDENGKDLQLADHAEVYKLNFSHDEETNTYNYDLVQEEGMDGSSQSSMDYSRRKHS